MTDRGGSRDEAHERRKNKEGDHVLAVVVAESQKGRARSLHRLLQTGTGLPTEGICVLGKWMDNVTIVKISSQSVTSVYSSTT